MSAFSARAEIAKIARLIDAEPDSLGWLERAPADDLRELRERATDALYDRDEHLLRRVAAASRHLPAAVVAAIGQRAFGPLLCARVAGVLDPERASDVAKRLPVDFLADVAEHLDPRRATGMLGGIPREHIAAVAAELARRGDFVAVGRFGGYLDPETIGATIVLLDDDELLEVALVLEGAEALERTAEVISPERLAAIVRIAAERELWPEMLELVEQLSPERRAEVAAVVSDAGEGIAPSLVQAAGEHDLWAPLLRAVALMPEDRRRRAAKLRALQREGALAQIVETAAALDLWRELLPVVPALGKATAARVAGHVEALAPAKAARGAQVAGELGLLERLGPVGEALATRAGAA